MAFVEIGGVGQWIMFTFIILSANEKRMIHRNPESHKSFSFHTSITHFPFPALLFFSLSLFFSSFFYLPFFCWIMALDESSNMLFSSSTMLEDEDDHDTDDADEHHPHPHNLSRLSVCTSSMYTIDDDDYQDCDGMKMFMSRLSLESFDADEELSDEKEGIDLLDLPSDSDEEPGCYSLPATPPRRRNRGGLVNKNLVGAKEYASENEAQKGSMMRKSLRRRRRVARERWVDGDSKSKKKDEECVGAGMGNYYGYCNSFSGESEGGGLVVITRPKGGRRSLCMDLDEVKACRDLGFELEHERMLEMPGRVSLSGSNLDTSSGGNSPIANWRISSPGDDPREVKARLKVWAQAVALASASRHGGT